MTDAQVSQVAVETIRTNLAVDVQVSQLAVEVLRPNVAKGISASAGGFTLTGRTSIGTYRRAVAGAKGTFTIAGVSAGKSQTYRLSGAKGTFSWTGIEAQFLRPGKLITETGSFILTGQVAGLKTKRFLYATTATYTLTGIAAQFDIVRDVLGSTGAFILTGGDAGLSPVYNVVDPVSNITIFSRLRVRATPYASADAAYETWATTLGVSSTGTDYTASTSINVSDFVTTSVPPLDGGTYAGFDIPHGGAIALYMTDPGVYTATSAIYSVGGVDLGYVTLPAHRPVFTFSASNNLSSVAPTLNYNLKLRRGMNPTTGAQEIIIVYTRADVSTQAYPMRCAYRIANGLFEAVVTAEPANIPTLGAARIQFIVANETTDIPASGRILSTSFSGTINIISDDFSGLRPFISDLVQLAEDTATKRIKNHTQADTLSFIDRAISHWGLTILNTVVGTDAVTFAIKPGAVIEELINIVETHAPSWKFSQLLAERVFLQDAIIAAFPVTVTDDVTLTELIEVFRGAIIAELIGLVDVPQGAAQMATQLVDTLLASDDLRRFLGGDIQESLAATDAIVYAPILGKVITDSIALSDLAAGKLIFRVTADETFALDDATALKTIFSPVVTDGVEIAIGYIEPNGSFTTWAINTRTGAVTEYQNYSFNSFCQNGHKYLGASASGLYELDGDDDAGSDIIAQIKSGFAQFGGSKYSSFKAAYLGMRGDGDIILKLETGDNKSYTYQTVIQDMQSTKVRLGKGLRARYFSFELISTGPDFDLDTIEFIPLVAQRRV